MSTLPSSFVSQARLSVRIADMARIGATVAGGVDRPALSADDAVAQRELIGWGATLGMTATRDVVGNLFLRLQGTDADAAPVLSGSHLDSQPTGGHYDGVFGVLGALEAVQAIVDAGLQPARSIEVVAWMNEEGSRFAPGMMGSAVFAGDRALAETKAVLDSAGISVGQALAETAERLKDIPARPLGGDVHAYVEAHIEQGPVLEREGIPVGVVTGIQGKAVFRVTVEGVASHAGTSERRHRKDALLAATEMVQALAGVLHDEEDIVKFTVGRFETTPNAPSVVASKVVFSIDLRHPDIATLRRLADAVAPTCEAHAGPCSVRVDRLSYADSLTFPADMQARIRDAAAAIGIRSMDLASAAGHDARYLHAICPSAMIFVPCHLGITHNEAEYTAPEDLAAGARVLADVLWSLAARA
jgi:N-carbamoyl-L-amino-acid hydrolase